MNAQEAIAVIAYFGAAFPNFDPPDDTIDVWVNETADLDPGDAGTAMRNLVQRSKFPPSIAEFRQECRTLALLRQQNRTNLLALPSARQPFPTELAESIKRTLSEKGTRQHWHGGPNPCPVCGGMKSGSCRPVAAGTSGAVS